MPAKKKAVSSAKKTPKKAAKKPKKPAKKATKTKAEPKKGKKVKTGQKYECRVCGFRFVVDDCGCVEEHYLTCCSEPMKQKRKPRTKKTAA